MEVSLFTSTTQPCWVVPSAPPGSKVIHYPARHSKFIEILQGIKAGLWEPLVNKARTGGNYDQDKKRLPCFTPGGTFLIRRDSDLLTYSHLICLDYDKVDSVYQLKESVCAIKHTVAAFYSPSMRGVKVFVRVLTGPADHKKAFESVKAFYDEALGLVSDSHVKNISRLCYVSFDRDVYYHPDASPFVVAEKAQVYRQVTPDMSLLASPETAFGWLYNFTLKGTYQGGDVTPVPGNRNNFLFLFACNCNRYGIDQATAAQWVINLWVHDNSGLPQSELERTVASAYRHVAEHGKFKLPSILS